MDSMMEAMGYRQVTQDKYLNAIKKQYKRIDRALRQEIMTEGVYELTKRLVQVLSDIDDYINTKDLNT